MYELVRGDVHAGFDGSKSKLDYEKLFYILPFDNKSVLIASKIYSSLRKDGKLIDERNLIIGSICIANNLPLATLNKRHFERLRKFGLKLVEI